jgi:hypothetical protein
MRKFTHPLAIAIAGLLIAAPALAVKTSHWLHTTEADFKEGTATNVVASNLGDLKLSRQVKTLLSDDARLSAVFALAQGPDGTIYAGTGPDGILLAVKDDKVSTAADLGAHVNLVSLLIDSKGRLLIGTAGEKGEIFRIDGAGEKPKSIFSAAGVQYIWSMVETPDGNVYAATGPNGQIFQINPDDTNKVLYDGNENNILCMLSDGKDLLYFGTDPDGLVCRLNRRTGEFFVIYDAPESEISALVKDTQGNIYAATAENNDQETAADNAAGAGEQVGRPESENRAAPIPSNPPAAPKPPDVPNPAPGEPLPIPNVVKPMSMMIQADAGDAPEPPGKSPSTAPGARAPSPPHSSHSTVEAVPPAPNGNAIYRIDPDGFVTEVFRQPDSVFAMVEQDNAILVATGDEGELYQINPFAEENLILAKVDPKDIMCLLPTRDGRVFMGMANSGAIAAMTSGYATQGTYVSPVLDAHQISRFGKIQLRGTLPAGTSLKVATRSGNLEEASMNGWSNWSDDIPASEFVQVPSPSARFLQYRLTFTSNPNGLSTPVVEEIDTAYQMPNQAPQIKSIKINEPSADDDAGSDAHQGTGKVTIAWVATDPNEDELEYKLYFRNGSRQPWILLKDKLKDPTFDWDTRGVGDGRYEIKVEASDAASNPPGQGKVSSRVSDPIVVDNTPPLIGDIKTSISGADATISLNVVDRTSTVAKLDYSIDSARNWQLVLPSDNIADSPQEAYQFVVPLPAGAHQVTLRATDAKGNRSFESVSVTVDKK